MNIILFFDKLIELNPDINLSKNIIYDHKPKYLQNSFNIQKLRESNYAELENNVFFKNNTNKVDYLNLQSSNLSKLPDEISLFKELRILNLSSNLIHQLPNNIQKLENLEILNIMGNPNLSNIPDVIFKWLF